MMEIPVQVLLQLDHKEDSEWEDWAAAEVAAKEAIENALQIADKAGLVHSLADDISIGLVDIAVVPHGDRWLLSHTHEHGCTFNEFVYQPTPEKPFPSALAMAKAFGLIYDPSLGEEIQLFELDGLEPVAYTADAVGTEDEGETFDGSALLEAGL